MPLYLPVEIIKMIFQYQDEMFFFSKQQRILKVLTLDKVVKHKCEQKMVNNVLIIDLPINQKKTYFMNYLFLSYHDQIHSYLYRAYVFIEREMYVSRQLTNWTETNHRWELINSDSHLCLRYPY